MLSLIERRYGEHLSVAADRYRALLWRLRGAELGDRTRVGRGCAIQRPWRLLTGECAQFEHSVRVKITNELATVSIGANVFLGYGAELDVSEKLYIGDHVLIAPGCFITDHDHRHSATATIASQGCDSAPVHIGDDVWLGAHAVVLSGVTIGSGAIVGANAVVRNDVEPMSIVAGIPARIIGKRK